MRKNTTTTDTAAIAMSCSLGLQSANPHSSETFCEKVGHAVNAPLRRNDWWVQLRDTTPLEWKSKNHLAYNGTGKGLAQSNPPQIASAG